MHRISKVATEEPTVMPEDRAADTEDQGEKRRERKDEEKENLYKQLEQRSMYSLHVHPQ